MAFDLRYWVTGWSPGGNSLKLDILQEDSATEVTGIDGIFATGQIFTDTVLTGATVGGTFVVSGASSSNNDGRYTITAIDLGGGAPAPYVNVYDVEENPGTLEEDTTGFTVRVEDSQKVKCKPYIYTIKWGEEVTPDGSDRHSKYQPIQRAYLTCELKNETTRQYEDLFTEDGYICQAYRNGALFWAGQLKPQLYQAPKRVAPYFTKAMFSDLDVLQEKRFFIPEADTRQTISAVLAHTLKQTGLVYGLNETVNVYGNSFSQADDNSPLDQAEVMPECWYEKEATFWDFLVDICTIFGARIFQEDATWYLHRINEYSGEYLQRSFDSDGVIVAASGTWIDTVNTITETNAFSEDEISIIRKADYVKVEAAQGQEKAYTENAFFEDWTAGVPDHWTNSGLTLTQVTDRITGSNGIQIDLIASSNYLQATSHAVNSAEPGTIKGKYKLHSSQIDMTTGAGATFRYSLLAGAYWLDANDAWTNSGEQILSYTDHLYADVWVDFNISIPIDTHPTAPATVTGVILKLHGPAKTVIFDSISYLGKNNRVPPAAAPFIYDNEQFPGTNGDGSIPVALTSGIDATLSSNRVFSSIITEDTYWERKGNASETFKLPEILLESIKDENTDHQLAGNLQINKIIRMRFPTVFTELDSKRFIANGITYFAGDDAFKGQFMEIISTPVYTELPPP